MVTVYNKTNHPINEIVFGTPYSVPATAGGIVGQILVSPKTAKTLIAQNSGLCLDRPESVFEKELSTVKTENAALKEENDKLKKDNDFLSNQLEKIKEARKNEKK